jgi:hypothetical protein
MIMLEQHVTDSIVVQYEEEIPEGEEAVPDAGAMEVEDDLYANDKDDAEPAQANLHPDDPGNFFKLSEFLKIVLAHSITDKDIDQAETLIRAYCTELLHVSVYLEIIPCSSEAHTHSFVSSTERA